MRKFALVTVALIALQLPMSVLADDAPSSPMEQAISTLPQDKAQGFRDSLQSAHEENAPLYQKAQHLHAQLHDILAADNFDRNAFTAKNKELRKVHDKIHANLDDAFADGLSNLSTSDRQKLLAALEQQHTANKATKEAE